MKGCAACEQEMPLTEFSPAYRRADGTVGRNPLCRPCRNARRRRTDVQEELPPGMKRCSQCSQVKGEEEFYFRSDSRANGRRHAHCKACKAHWSKKRSQEKPPEQRQAEGLDSRLRHRYGITPAQYEEMLREQDGVCAICQRPSPNFRRLSVDHDHVTGAVRRLLCTKCNAGLGSFDENPDFLLAAVDYLRSHGTCVESR